MEKIYKSRYQAYKAKSIYETVVRLRKGEYILVKTNKKQC